VSFDFSITMICAKRNRNSPMKSSPKAR